MLLPPHTSDEAILVRVRDWVSALAREDYAGALSLIGGRKHWTAEVLRSVITNYGSLEPCEDGATFRVTPLELAVNVDRAPVHNVEWWDDEFGEVWFDLPLNGEWSDLTATFGLTRYPDGIQLILDDVHVH